MKEEGTPFKIVAERSREAKKVMATPKRITQVSKTASSRACNIRESRVKLWQRKLSALPESWENGHYRGQNCWSELQSAVPWENQ